ncbi:endolytic transglycosylase MltG [Rhodoferax saidenbachensis]|uniref:Endolytic murein transglycosylase n=1 Tax=Rhodoferax saidenbachensis TaxID=1484693 RepID=A0A1P8KAB0_9BURK|nr:endolytic transglycosylase MltG [Rhodoferax saidenbachensis]APW42930.1 aminodeoxychorismate lyase [Rhodoferax saidenbachensis]
MRFLFVVLLAAVLGLGGAGYSWLNRPLDLSAPTVDLSIEPGSSAREVAMDVADAGVAVDTTLLYWWFRLSGKSRQIKAGSYELTGVVTPQTLLRKLVNGEEALRSVTLVEGWTFRQVREALKKADQLKPLTQDLSPEAIMAQLGKPGQHPEGRFFPDTYTYAKGSSDLAVLQRAQRAMEKRLAAAWALRDPASPLQSADDALVLASIVEKETGRASDRPMVASVFNNRLRIGMRLQTDPTVIYGLGESFDGNLRKNDLLTDTPWNTYTRTGLPPTPIAMPGKASLIAAVQPAQSKALYFVARGDGTSQFSASLDEHNRAVNKYQRGQ